jgi:hypothetical protein
MPAQLILEFDPAPNGRGRSWVRLIRVMDDGCSPHVLADWFEVRNGAEARQVATREGATLRNVGARP